MTAAEYEDQIIAKVIRRDRDDVIVGPWRIRRVRRREAGELTSSFIASRPAASGTAVRVTSPDVVRLAPLLVACDDAVHAKAAA